MPCHGWSTNIVTWRGQDSWILPLLDNKIIFLEAEWQKQRVPCGVWKGQIQTLYVNCVQKERPKLLTRVAQRTGGLRNGWGGRWGWREEENSLSAWRGKFSTNSFPAEHKKGTLLGYPLQVPGKQEAAWTLPLGVSWFTECSGLFPGAGVRPQAKPLMACHTSKVLSNHVHLLGAGPRWSPCSACSWAHFLWPSIGCSEWSGSWQWLDYGPTWSRHRRQEGEGMSLRPCYTPDLDWMLSRHCLMYPHFTQEDVEAQ